MLVTLFILFLYKMLELNRHQNKRKEEYVFKKILLPFRAKHLVFVPDRESG